MNSKQLVKVIKTLVEAEVAKKHEQFLTKTFPKILKELNSTKTQTTEVVEATNEVDPFVQAELALQEERTQPKKQFTKNDAINEALNNTKPFTAAQRKGGVEQKSVLDSFQQQPVNENMDKTVTFNQQGAGAGLQGMRANMAAQMGYGDVKTGPSKTGLGVQTGLPGLDRILNRDNSALVKKFKR
jgi:signal transduction histidine kinase